MSESQKRVVEYWFESGMKKLDVGALLSVMSDDATWFGVTTGSGGGVARKTYRGKQAIKGYMDGTLGQFKDGLIFTMRHVLDGPDLVMTEWTDFAKMIDGGEYNNRGITIFEFVPGTDKLQEVRQYFDFTDFSLAGRSDWATKMLAVSSTDAIPRSGATG